MAFRLTVDHRPRGDQESAIEQLAKAVEDGEKHQVLLGVTGSSKTFTMAKVIERIGRRLRNQAATGGNRRLPCVGGLPRRPLMRDRDAAPGQAIREATAILGNTLVRLLFPNRAGRKLDLTSQQFAGSLRSQPR